MATPYAKLVTALNDAVKTGKVLDVSKLSADGKGSRTIPMPKSGKGTKKWVDNFPVLSNNYASYALAMQILGPEYAVYSQQYANLYGTGAYVRAPKTGVAAKMPTTAFPVHMNTPAAVVIAPQAIKTPGRAKTPKGAKSPAVQQPAILQVTAQQVVVPQVTIPVQPWAVTGMKVASPRMQMQAIQVTKPLSPPRVTMIPTVPTVKVATPPRVPTVPLVKVATPQVPTVPLVKVPSPKTVSPRVPTVPTVKLPSPTRVATPPRMPTVQSPSALQ